MSEEIINGRIRYLKKQNDIKKIQLFSDLEPDYASFSLGGLLFVSDKFIYPAGGGFDIGCGVGLYQFDKKVEFDEIKWCLDDLSIFGIPQQHISLITEKSGYNYCNLFEETLDEWKLGQIETGNHFVELLKDTEGNCYILIHSGIMTPSKNVFEYIFIEAYKKMKEIYNDTNGYCVTIDLKTNEADDALLSYERAEIIARNNREYIARQIGKELGSEITSIVDTSHEFITKIGEKVYHSNGVQKLEKRDGYFEGMLLCGYGESSRLIRTSNDTEFYNHGTKFTVKEGKREYSTFEEFLEDEKELEKKLEVNKILTPHISCKNKGGRYVYRFFK